MNNNEAKKTILEAESCFCKHGAYKDCHSGCKYREALDAAIKALEQEPTTKNNLGVDCIDRKFAISVLNDVFHGAISDSNMRVYEIINWLNGLPSVTPQPRKGHWISTETKGVRYAFWCRYKCSLCGGLSDHTNFCPNCGAKMVEPQKSEG